jgi:hypothetical protein
MTEGRGRTPAGPGDLGSAAGRPSRARCHRLRDRFSLGPSGGRGDRAGALRSGPRHGFVARGITHHPAGVLRGPLLRPLGLARLPAVARANWGRSPERPSSPLSPLVGSSRIVPGIWRSTWAASLPSMPAPRGQARGDRCTPIGELDVPRSASRSPGRSPTPPWLALGLPDRTFAPLWPPPGPGL